VQETAILTELTRVGIGPLQWIAWRGVQFGVAVERSRSGTIARLCRAELAVVRTAADVHFPSRSYAMKKYLIVLASGLLFATTATMADPPQWRGQQGHDQQNDQGKHGNHGRHDNKDRRDYRSDRGDRHERNDRGDRYQYDRSRYVRDSRGVHDHGGRSYVVHDHGRHEGWYKRGGYLPVQYRESRYYVTDWRARRLYEPPRGYRWVRSDNNDFLLVAIATGIITNIILSN
jgi:Ni/Co efflux regulator RcnB